jgi:phosphoglycolate phosphatase-like HAD superfamily hydrolase
VIRVVVTDLDNTLYDWVAYFVPSFNAMVSELRDATGIDEAELRKSFQRVHQRLGTTEYAFAIQELDVLAERHTTLSWREILDHYRSAVEAFREVRRETLRLYPGVAETIERLRSQGIKVVAHTDAMMFYAAARVRQLGLELQLDGLVAQRDHGLPSGVRPEDVRQYADEWYAPRVPYVEELERSLIKPNPGVLREILANVGASTTEALFVGDSLTRDVAMAQAAGTHDVYAAYGVTHDSDLYRQLVEITHWTASDVARETELRTVQVHPTWTIDSFDSLPEIVTELDGRPRLEAVN